MMWVPQSVKLPSRLSLCIKSCFCSYVADTCLDDDLDLLSGDLLLQDLDNLPFKRASPGREPE